MKFTLSLRKLMKVLNSITNYEEMLKQITKFYHQLRRDAEAEHRKVYEKAKQLAECVNSEECTPCIVHRSQRRPNAIVTSPENIAKTIPLLDSTISELEDQFSEDKRAHNELRSLTARKKVEER